MTVNNPVNFCAYNYPQILDKDCPICISSLEEGEIVAHENGGHLHPMHKDCVIENMKVSNLCPFCRVPMNADSLFSWKDRMIVELNQMKSDAENGALLGVIMGIFSVLFLKSLNLFKNEIENIEYIGFGVFVQLILEKRTNTKAAAVILSSITAVFLGTSRNFPNLVIISIATIAGATMSAATGILERRIQSVKLNSY